MGNFVFKLPDIGEGVVEGEVVQWHVSVGDSVSEDDPIVDVMTDKATVTIPSPVSGVISSLSGDVGDMIAVGSSLMEIDSEGEGGGPAAEDAEVQEPVPDPDPPKAPCSVRARSSPQGTRARSSPQGTRARSSPQGTRACPF